MDDKRLVSPEYHEVLRAMHALHPWGHRGDRYLDPIVQWYRQLGCSSLLDYGSGREALRVALERDHPDIDVRCYDPGIAGREQLPDLADFVVCSDVLEHIEAAYIDDVLTHIRAVMRVGGYLRIALTLAKRVLPDGRNAHILVQPRAWWLGKLKAHRFNLASVQGGKKSLIALVRC